MFEWLGIIARTLRSALRTRRALAVKNPVLRQQLAVLKHCHARPRREFFNRIGHLQTVVEFGRCHLKVRFPDVSLTWSHHSADRFRYRFAILASDAGLEAHGGMPLRDDHQRRRATIGNIPPIQLRTNRKSPTTLGARRTRQELPEATLERIYQVPRHQLWARSSRARTFQPRLRGASALRRG